MSPGIQIKVASVFVDDQDKALSFYRDKLGFVVKHDIPLGGDHRWLSVVSRENLDGTQLILEPNAHPASKAFQEAIFADGIPATSFFVDEIESECERLKNAGVEFKTEPTRAGNVSIAVINDTCGNYLQLTQQHGE